MAKLLILFRHGKSDWEAPFSHDRDRPLAPRGIQAAQRMGRGLTLAGITPDRILTSPALRAHTTAQLAHQAGNWNPPLELCPELYEAEVPQVLHLLQQQPDTVQTLLLVGHEPTGSALTVTLMGGGQVRIPTAAMVGLELASETWFGVAPGCGCLQWLWHPRRLPGS